MHCVAYVGTGGKEAPLPAPEAILRHPSIILIIQFLPTISHSSHILYFLWILLKYLTASGTFKNPTWISVDQ